MNDVVEVINNQSEPYASTSERANQTLRRATQIVGSLAVAASLAACGNQTKPQVIVEHATQEAIYPPAPEAIQCKDEMEVDEAFPQNRLQQIQSDSSTVKITSNSHFELYSANQALSKQYNQLLFEAMADISDNIFFQIINKKDPISIYINPNLQLSPGIALSEDLIDIAQLETLQKYVQMFGLDPKNNEHLKRFLRVMIMHERVHQVRGSRSFKSPSDGSDLKSKGFLIYQPCVNQDDETEYIEKYEDTFEEAFARALTTLFSKNSDKGLSEKVAVYSPASTGVTYEAEYHLLLEILGLAPDLNQEVKILLNLKAEGDVITALDELYAIVNRASGKSISDEKADKLRGGLHNLEAKLFKLQEQNN